MTQEDKDLLLRDLCMRLHYKVKVQDTYYKSLEPNPIWLLDLNTQSVRLFADEGYQSIEYIKPYLFPLSSMTYELWDKEFSGCGITEFTRDSFKYGCETLDFNRSNPNLSSMVRFINRLIKNHFDIYGLIPKGLALDASGKNIY